MHFCHLKGYIISFKIDYLVFHDAFVVVTSLIIAYCRKRSQNMRSF